MAGGEAAHMSDAGSELRGGMAVQMPAEASSSVSAGLAAPVAAAVSSPNPAAWSDASQNAAALLGHPALMAYVQQLSAGLGGGMLYEQAAGVTDPFTSLWMHYVSALHHQSTVHPAMAASLYGAGAQHGAQSGAGGLCAGLPGAHGAQHGAPGAQHGSPGLGAGRGVVLGAEAFGAPAVARIGALGADTAGTTVEARGLSSGHGPGSRGGRGSRGRSNASAASAEATGAAAGTMAAGRGSAAAGRASSRRGVKRAAEDDAEGSSAPSARTNTSDPAQDGGAAAVEAAMTSASAAAGGDADDDGEGGEKKQRFVWSKEVHQRFVKVVHALGVDSAKPQKIAEELARLAPDAPGLPTRQNIKSHLQKYRLLLAKQRDEGDTLGLGLGMFETKSVMFELPSLPGSEPSRNPPQPPPPLATLMQLPPPGLPQSEGARTGTSDPAQDGGAAAVEAAMTSASAAAGGDADDAAAPPVPEAPRILSAKALGKRKVGSW